MENLCQNETITEPLRTSESKTENVNELSISAIPNQKESVKEMLIIPVGKIYLIINLINNKKYVGITTKTIEKRFKEHLRQRPNYRRVLHNSIRKYGKENFKIELIEELLEITEKDLLLKETYWIDKYNTFIDNGCGYNLVKENTQKLIYSRLTRQKMSKNRIGEKNNFYGKFHSDESKKLMSKSHEGNKAHLGKRHTKETKERLSSMLSGENAGRFNSKIMRFKNINTDEEFIGCQYHFRKKYNLKNPTLSKLVNGKTKSYRGWVLM